jgi:hypothetical protein
MNHNEKTRAMGDAKAISSKRDTIKIPSSRIRFKKVMSNKWADHGSPMKTNSYPKEVFRFKKDVTIA